MDPIGLRNKPSLPWYYKVFLEHFLILSNSRSKRLTAVPDKNGYPIFQSLPNPIDIPTILRYNKEVVKMANPADFLYLMQSLDQKFLDESK